MLKQFNITPKSHAKKKSTHWNFSASKTVSLSLKKWSRPPFDLLKYIQEQRGTQSKWRNTLLSKCGASHDSPTVLVVSICLLWMTRDVFELSHRIRIDAVIKPIQINTMCAWYVTYCRTSAFVSLICYSFVVSEDISWNSHAELSHAQRYTVNVLNLMNKLGVASRLGLQYVDDCVSQIHCWNTLHP